MALSLFVPLLLAGLFFLVVAKLTLFRSRYELSDVILFVRKLEVEDLAKLLDPGEEWVSRNLYSEKEFRKLQRERMRLAIEYLRRVGHNAEVIQTWATSLYEKIKYKTDIDFTRQDFLVCELVDLSTELRICNAAALLKATFWLVFLSHLWPLKFIPRMTELRTTGEVDVVKKYRMLIEISTALSLTFGERYCEELTAAF